MSSEPISAAELLKSLGGSTVLGALGFFYLKRKFAQFEETVENVKEARRRADAALTEVDIHRGQLDAIKDLKKTMETTQETLLGVKKTIENIEDKTETMLVTTVQLKERQESLKERVDRLDNPRN